MIVDAVIRASCDAFELSVGKVTRTPVLFTAWPAATFAFKSCARHHQLPVPLFHYKGQGGVYVQQGTKRGREGMCRGS